MSFEAVPTTLLGLVQHYSPSGEESTAAAWLVERMGALGFDHSSIDGAGNAVGWLGGGPRQIILLGHIDTVPGEILVRVQNGCLYGRGSVDAKGPLACFVDAAAEAGAAPGWQVIVIGAVEEERHSAGARYVASRYKPDYTLIGEPNRWDRVALGYKGSACAQMTARQPQAHSAGSQPSACDVVMHAWQSVQAWAQEFNTSRERLFDQLLLTVRGMDSSEDGYTSRARLAITARLPLDLTPLDWYARLAEQAPGVETQPEPGSYAIPAYQCEKNTPVVRALLSSIRSSGGSPAFVYKTGTADLNIVAPAWGCPAAVYGPGDSSLDHTPNEHIDLAEYHHAVNVLTSTLRILTREL